MDGNEKIKVITKGDQSFTVTCSDPYGFWTVRMNRTGPTPKDFTGQYTSFHDAEKAITSYVNNKKIEDNKPSSEQKRQAKTFPNTQAE